MAAIIFTCRKCHSEIEMEGMPSGGMARCPRCDGTVVIPVQGIMPGMRLGGFELIRRVGVGGMGQVWLADQLALGRQVAIKILSPVLAGNKEFTDRFLKEVRTSAMMNHPNIVTVYEAGHDKNLYYLATNYVEGKTLEQLIEEGYIQTEIGILEIASAISSALKYAWDKFKIVHRDVKPANIIIDVDNRAVLTDLGICKSISENTVLTEVGVAVGSPYYMSPEQGKAAPDLDFRADIYSLGATLYHATTGAYPFDAESPMGILVKHIVEKLRPPQELNPGLSQGCSTLIMKMMAKKPENRHRSWDDVIDDINLVLMGGVPAGAYATFMAIESPEEVAKQAMRRRKIVVEAPKAKLREAHAPPKGVLPVSVEELKASSRKTLTQSTVIWTISMAGLFVVAVVVGWGAYVAYLNSKNAREEVKQRIAAIGMPQEPSLPDSADGQSGQVQAAQTENPPVAPRQTEPSMEAPTESVDHEIEVQSSVPPSDTGVKDRLKAEGQREIEEKQRRIEEAQKQSLQERKLLAAKLKTERLRTKRVEAYEDELKEKTKAIRELYLTDCPQKHFKNIKDRLAPFLKEEVRVSQIPELVDTELKAEMLVVAKAFQVWSVKIREAVAIAEDFWNSFIDCGSMIDGASFQIDAPHGKGKSTRVKMSANAIEMRDSFLKYSCQSTVKNTPPEKREIQVDKLPQEAIDVLVVKFNEKSLAYRKTNALFYYHLGNGDFLAAEKFLPKDDSADFWRGELEALKKVKK